jgi:hypothetical protein
MAAARSSQRKTRSRGRPAQRPPRRAPTPRTVSQFLYVAVAIIGLLLLYVAVRAAIG